MVFLYFFLFIMVFLGFILSLTRFLSCLIILENFNVLLLLFSLLLGLLDSHVLFIALMVVSTVEVIVGLVVLTRVWECTNSLDLVSF
uniref:NADH dehydrogenase subunit 4L n=3 Tax=Spirometra TaxID=46580 RepID=A0A6B9UEV0_SPIER|nr:NADH dehydrogenase subunit 4L [Spirometra erinaceieuropaei]YP_009131381.1 NADH dehydrogenase subunit 4L [Spirometra decipiens]BAG54984.1 NADH dehydrogenase subunit 4L [Spirometra mansoni]AIB52344.1 NADH dehydrogenase subunit 4L [Spirometra decipiens]AOS52811.1 NADH dehydrogenase subunit 4L [Spirometra erinaceieuropaei]ARX11418.1 NADH dehydrogenase subunit 4L [Spirometra erinaceieuropaei]ARX11430.1 NADH dehydrogenase subunit 4L [Spirometra erinaceieuropaei]